MLRNRERTELLLLRAATAEFAAVGIAGARVDAIALAAGVNKSMIYSYFGNKDELFDLVFSTTATRAVEEVPFDAVDLPGYAGRLFDSFEDNPALVRLTTWYQLERPGGTPLQAVVASNAAKISALRDAMDRGDIPDHFAPVELLALIRAVALSWFTTVPELGTHVPKRRARRRSVVVDAVRRLVTD